MEIPIDIALAEANFYWTEEELALCVSYIIELVQSLSKLCNQ